MTKHLQGVSIFFIISVLVIQRIAKAGGIWKNPCDSALFITTIVFKEICTPVHILFPSYRQMKNGRTDWLGEKHTHMCMHVYKCRQCVIWLHSICHLTLICMQKGKKKTWHMELPGSMWILLQHSCTYA